MYVCVVNKIEMKRNKIIYWTATGIISVMMLFSAISAITDPQFADTYRHLGFPSYFRVELAIAKIIGVLILLIPQIPARVKEWAYAGFAITFISSSIAHGFSGDPAPAVIAGVVFLVILFVSNIYYHAIRKTV